MKYIIATILLIGFGNNSYSQCLGASNFDIVMHNSYSMLCNTMATDINDVRVNETVAFKLNEIVSTDELTITWASDIDGVTFYNGGAQNGLSYPYSFENAGTHIITCTYDFDVSCTVVKTFSVTVSDRDCPFLVAGIPVQDMCSYPDQDIDVVITDDANFTYTIDNVSWIVTEGNNASYYSSTGNIFTFNPTPGTFTAEATATVTLSNNSVCVVPLVGAGSGCEIVLGNYMYSDPFFQVEGSLLANDVNEVIFKGTNISPLPASNHLYTLNINGQITANPFTDDSKSYNQWLYTIPNTPGEYIIKLEGSDLLRTCYDSYIDTIIILDSIVEPVECPTCNSFKPEVGEKYWVSAWVKENQAAQVLDYLDAYLKIKFVDAFQEISFSPTGEIIEGWQRIVGSFTIPTGTTSLDIQLMNDNVSIEAYFDDIRIHPFNASMKSYVYDPETLWLTAELDDNNYATIYEYDMEGQLIRIKKETSRGIMTIQESRSSNPKEN